MIMKFYCTLLIFFTIKFSYCQTADNEFDMYEINMYRGNILYGKLIKEGPDSISFDVVDIGLIALSKTDIEYYNLSSGPKVYTLSKELMYKENYLLSDNSFAPKRGSFYCHNQNILFNRFSFTPIKDIAIEIGEYNEFVNGNLAYIFSLKTCLPVSKQLRIGLKSLLLSNVANKSITIHSGMITAGTLQNNINIGLHYTTSTKIKSYIGEEESEVKLMYSISGIASISKKISIMFEHINFRNNIYTLNTGFTYSTKSLSFSAGAVIYTSYKKYKSDYYSYPIPVLGLKIPFKS
jgi:hypothetical protein